MYKAPLSAETLIEQEVRQLFERHTIAEIKGREDLTRCALHSNSPYTPPLYKIPIASLHAPPPKAPSRPLLSLLSLLSPVLTCVRCHLRAAT
jgi:hypothetical protein